jgi:uncharacterized repeat protein (TIGR03803 family)
MQINWNRCLILLSLLASFVAIAACSQTTDLSRLQYTPSVNGVSRASMSPRNYRVLYSFGAAPDGNYPRGRLVAVDGTLYGATGAGGRYCPGHIFRCGTVFSITTDGTEKVLHSFGKGTDGSYPASLIAVNGTLYGTTSGGGSYSQCQIDGFQGCGTVFSITTDGTEKVLHSFGKGTDGSHPLFGLIAVNGTLYGTTSLGGDHGYGTVFSITTDGTEKVLHGFGKGTDGSQPEGGLIDVKGTLYGTTIAGGSYQQGTVFSTTMGGTEKVLHSFNGSRTDGAIPSGYLADVNDTIYGTTINGGKYGIPGYTFGTVFSITTGGTEKVLHSFGKGADGLYPTTGLIEVKGTLYGTTSLGGRSYGGTVFSITTSGTEKTLHTFPRRGIGGINPGALSYENGNFFGTTRNAGTYGYGTVFALKP